MNPGGIRANLPPGGANPDRTVSYGDIFTVQPFGNSLVVMTLTGAQLKAVLEQQFDNPAPGQQRMLQISAGFTYTYDPKKAAGERVIAMQLQGSLSIPPPHIALLSTVSSPRVVIALPYCGKAPTA